jgi:hypothetical protein
MYRGIRAGDTFLACLYAFAIVGSWFVLVAECGSAFASLR